MLCKWKRSNIISHENDKRKLREQRSWVWKDQITITQQNAMYSQYIRYKYTLTNPLIDKYANVASTIETTRQLQKNSRETPNVSLQEPSTDWRRAYIKEPDKAGKSSKNSVSRMWRCLWTKVIVWRSPLQRYR